MVGTVRGFRSRGVARKKQHIREHEQADNDVRRVKGGNGVEDGSVGIAVRCQAFPVVKVLK